MVSRYLVMLNLCFLDIPHTFLGQGECPEPIRNHLCEQNDRQPTQEYSGPWVGRAREKPPIFIGFRTIKKNRCYIYIYITAKFCLSSEIEWLEVDLDLTNIFHQQFFFVK